MSFSKVVEKVLARLQPSLSLQQIIKGNAGVYVQEANGEQGTYQSMTIQGTSVPLFDIKDIYSVQPAIYINGLPLIQGNPFVYDIQKYDYNRIDNYAKSFNGISDFIKIVEVDGNSDKANYRQNMVFTAPGLQISNTSGCFPYMVLRNMSHRFFFASFFAFRLSLLSIL